MKKRFGFVSLISNWIIYLLLCINNHFKLNYYRISLSVLSLVSTKYFLLMKNAAKLHPAKKKNNGTGVPKALVSTGNNKMTRVAADQFARVE